jgi:hypothetical protein
MSITCGHWNFTDRGAWLLCHDCECGIKSDSRTGQRLLRKHYGNELGIPANLVSIHMSLRERYQQLIEKAGTSDPEVLARLANGGEK